LKLTSQPWRTMHTPCHTAAASSALCLFAQVNQGLFCSILTSAGSMKLQCSFGHTLVSCIFVHFWLLLTVLRSHTAPATARPYLGINLVLTRERSQDQGDVPAVRIRIWAPGVRTYSLEMGPPSWDGREVSALFFVTWRRQPPPCRW
jgi:hypothetical protein